MELLLLRHGITVAADSLRYPDDDRPLSPEGASRIVNEVQGIRTLFPSIDVIYSSPLQRAIETATLLAEPYKLTPTILNVLVNGPLKDLLSILKQCTASVCALVGHEPELVELVVLLTRRDRREIILERGGLAVVNFARMPNSPLTVYSPEELITLGQKAT